MWPFRRRTAATPAATVHRAGAADWRRLPPIATVQTAPMGTLDGGFEDHLATRRSPLFLEPLGHHLVPDGPSGRVAAAVVSGHARQFAPGRAVQRQTASYAEPAGAAVDLADEAPAPVDDHDADVEAEPTEVPTVGALTPTAATAPVTVTAPVAARQSLVQAPEPALPPLTLPAVAALSRQTEEVAADAGAPTEAVEAVEPVGEAPADIAEPPAVAAVEDVGLVGGTPTAPTIPATQPTSPSVAAPRAEPHRALQRTVAEPGPTAAAAPIRPDVDASMPVQRSVDPSLAASGPDVPEVSRDGEPVDADEAESPAGVVDEPATTPTLERLRTVLGPPIASTPPAARPEPTGQAPVQREPLGLSAHAPVPAAMPAGRAPTPGVVAPTARVDVPRSSTPAPGTAAGGDEPITRELPTLGRLAIGEHSVHSSQPPLDHGAPIGATPRSPDISASSPTSAPPEPTVASRPTLAGEWLTTAPAAAVPTVARQQQPAGATERAAAVDALARRQQSQSPPLSSPGAASGRPFAPVQRRTIIGPPITPLAPRPPSPDVHPPGRVAGTPPVDIEDVVDATESRITEWPPVQRESAGQASAVTMDETPVMTAAATSGPAAMSASPPEGRSDADVDELLRALYPPLRRRLCRDLLLDRERAGYGTDIRF